MSDNGPNKRHTIPSLRLVEGPRQNGAEYDFSSPDELLAKIEEQLELQGYDAEQIRDFMIYASSGEILPSGVPVYVDPTTDEDEDPVEASSCWNAWSIGEVEDYLRYPDDEETPIHDARWVDGPATLVIAHPDHFVGVSGSNHTPSSDYNIEDIILLVDLPDPLN